MNKSDEVEKYSFRLGFNDYPLTLAEYTRRIKSYLRWLMEFDESFTRLGSYCMHSFADKDFSEFQLDTLDKLDDMIGKLVLHKDRADDWYTHKSADGGLTSASTSATGFDVIFYGYSIYGDDPYFNAGCVRVYIRIGGNNSEIPATVKIDFPHNTYSDIHSYKKVKKLLIESVAFWNPVWAHITSEKFHKIIKESSSHDIRTDLLPIGWMVYFNHPIWPSNLPNGVEYEALPQGGTLVCVGEDRIDPSNQMQVKKANEICSLLADAYIIQNSTGIYGIPPLSEEELIYREIITGTPRDRAYKVKWVEFDGYDAERNVLLYTRLFKDYLLPDRGPNWDLRSSELAVIYEAQRQLLVSSGTRIEWHIGLVEYAEAARKLIYKNTEITEDQIKIVYTPLELALKTQEEEK